MAMLVVDVGGTHIRFYRGGVMIAKEPTKDPIQQIRKWRKEEDLAISVAGWIRDGKVWAPNIPALWGANLKIFGERVYVENDANAFTWGEYRFGAGKGTRNMIGVVLGTGLGGGIIVDGKLYRGRGAAGELGHMVIDINGPKCACGRRGCIESFVGGWAIKKRYGLPEKVLPKIARNLARYLQVAIDNYYKILDPDMIVLGGPIGHALYPYLEGVVEAKLENANILGVEDLATREGGLQ